MEANVTMHPVLRTSKGHAVVVLLTDAEACNVLQTELVGSDVPNEFMVSLVRAFRSRGSWSPGQRPWAHKLANDIVDRASSTEPAAPAVVFPRIVEMLRSATATLKHPRVVVTFDGGSIRLGLAGAQARVPGSLSVTTDGAYGDRKWFGRILPDGRWEPSQGCPEWVVDGLRAFNADPAGVASAHGRKLGSCCFCQRELSTSESLAVGYGPVCADKYGLPWGEVPERVAAILDAVDEARDAEEAHRAA